MANTIPAGETREIQFQALVYVNGSRADSTDMDVEVAFPAPGDTPSEWLTGEWVRSGRASVTVGPDDTVLSEGRYDMWARVDEQEEQRLGAVTVV